MKKHNALLLFFIVGCFCAHYVIACTAVDSDFTLNIGNLAINIEKLEKLCVSDNCTTSREYVTIQSQYDSRVALIIAKTASTMGIAGITVRLPYVLADNSPVASTIKPKNYNWKESVKTDLQYLQSLGIVELTRSGITAIADLATNNGTILFCQNQWILFASNCNCAGCVQCAGAPAIATTVPKKPLVVK